MTNRLSRSSGKPPELRAGLDEHLVELIEENEALLPSAANEDVEVVHRCLDRHALLHGHVVIDDQLVLRVVGGVEGEQVRHLLTLFQLVHERFGHHSEPLVISGERLVEDEHRDAPGGAKAGNRGRFKELELHVAQRAAFFFEVHNDLACRSLAFGPGLQVDDTGSRVRAAAFGQNFITGQRGHGGDFFDLLGDLLELLGFGVGVLERGAWRRLEDGVDDALVLAWDKARRELRVDSSDAGGKASDDGHGQRAARSDPPYDRGITARDLLDGAVKRLPHERQKNEQEASRAPQLIRQIRYSAQDQQPSKPQKQLDSQSARLFAVARFGLSVDVARVGVRVGVARCGSQCRGVHGASRSSHRVRGSASGPPARTE